MTGMDGRLHDKANGAFFPIVHGMELLRVQQRLLASLLRQPGLVPTVLTTGIGPEKFPRGIAPRLHRGNEGPRSRKADSSRPHRRSDDQAFIHASDRFVGTWASPTNGGADYRQ